MLRSVLHIYQTWNPSSVVTSWSFRCILCSEGPGNLVSSNELRKLEEHGRAPPPFHNPAQPGRITSGIATSDEESGKNYFKFRLNFIGFYLLLRSTTDCGRRNVQAHLMMSRRMCGMLLQSTLPSKKYNGYGWDCRTYLEQNREIHAPSRIIHTLRTHWESHQPLSLPTDSGVQTFVQINMSAWPLVPIRSWNQNYRDQ